MKIGVVGLGRMGSAVAWRLIKGGYQVLGFDPNQIAIDTAGKDGVTCVKSLEELARQVEVVWIMVPAGKLVDDVLTVMTPHLVAGRVVVDGGNSHFTDSVRRYKNLKEAGISFLDCGTSGGVQGKELGFSLMIGGDRPTYEKLVPMFQAIAVSNGYAYLGPSGAGHYVKMVHNGVEYALLQAYAEGLHLLKEGKYPQLDLQQVCQVWNKGSVVRSWIVELARQVFEKDQKLENISGEVGENQTGQWTVTEAHEQKVPVKIIEQALAARAWSRQTGGNFATKIVAMLRYQFGGHEVKKKIQKI